MGSARASTASPPSADSLLGGRAVLRRKPRSELEWVAAVRRGLPAGVVDALTGSLGVTQAHLAASLGISERTLVRRKSQGRLNVEESDKMLRAARTVERAAEVFEGLAPALDWLKTPNTALSSVTPFSLLDTAVGAEAVWDTLGRIEHGVFG